MSSIKLRKAARHLIHVPALHLAWPVTDHWDTSLAALLNGLVFWGPCLTLVGLLSTYYTASFASRLRLGVGA